MNRTTRRTYGIVAAAALAACIGLGGFWGMSSARVQRMAAALVTSTPPTLVSYQGVVEVNGSPYDGSGNFVFKLFDAAAGGTELWSETQTGLAVTDGVFQTNLGVTTPLTADLFDGSERWLEVTFGSDVLSPRQRITSVPYALRANVADSAASVVTLGDDPAVCGAATQGALRFKDGNLQLCDGSTWYEVALTEYTPPPDDPEDIVIYDSGLSAGAAIGGRAGADARCAAAAGLPDGYATARALLSVNASDEIRDFPDLYGLPTDRTVNSTTDVQIADNWADLLDGSIDQPLVNAGVLPPNRQWWSGSTANGAVSQNCSGFVAPGPSGTTGFSIYPDSRWITFNGGFSCTSTAHVLCIAY